MDLRPDARCSLAVITSMGTRLVPEHRAPTHVSTRFTLQATSAESNVASVTAALGLPTTVMSCFVEGNPVSSLIKADLRARGIHVEGPDKPQGGPWGLRHQTNIADSGFGPRAPRVWNDRAGEVGLTLALDDFDLDRLFGDEGVQVLHLSGLVAALSTDVARFCLELARVAKQHGTAVSFDLNHRASFWEGREEELREAFVEIARVADVLVGNEEDFQLALGIEGPEAGGAGLDDELDAFAEMLERITQAFPQAQVVATTLREVVTANRHRWGAVLWADGETHVAEPREIDVLDRIGGGDGFVGGMLHGLLRGWEPERCLQFGWATGALAAASATDYASPADEAQVWDVWSGNARVQR